jgi:DNA-binding response OmpR family regulator
MAKVLIVDDDQAFCRLVVRLFARRPDILPTVAWSLADATKKLDTDAFDLVLLDLRLPDGNGLDLLAGLRNRGSLVPVVVISGVDDSGTAARALREGADDFLFKSNLEPDEFLARVDSALRRGRAARTVCTWEELAIDLVAGRATVRGEALALTPIQLRLLIALVLRAPLPVSLPDLAAIGWANGAPPSRGSFDNQILALRRQLARFGIHLSSRTSAGCALERSSHEHRATDAPDAPADSRTAP